MKILLTGGAGYIGRVMLSHLLDKSHAVRVLDNLLYGNHVNPGRSFEMIHGSVTDTALLRKSLVDVDAVIHLAAIVGDQACDLDVKRATSTNLESTRELARACRASKKLLVFFSTCSVYGANPNALLNEGSEVNPLSTYAHTKLSAEDELRKAQCDYVILRLGTVFGVSPRMRFDLVINRMIGQAVLNGRFTVFGGDQFRPFIHVGDVVSNTMRVIESESRGLYNLGGTNFTIRHIGEMIQHSTGCDMAVLPERKDPRNYAVDSSVAQNAWGASFGKNVSGAVDEISTFAKTNSIKSCDEPIYNNAEWLRIHG